ncbi:MAG: thioredoxin domain-containing protein, partial [Bacteroidia bacterium]
MASWNALMIKGLVDAAKIFNENSFLDTAIKANKFICENLINEGILYHSYKNGKLGVNGFLEDYAFLADALLSLFEVTADKKYLDKAIELINYSIQHFYDDKSGMFFYTADNAEQLIARKMEVTDNVTPASNSVMANVLYRLYRLTDNTFYYEKTIKMLKAMQEFIQGYGSAYSNWMMLQQQILSFKKELVIYGNNSKQFYHQVHQHYLPDTLVVYSEKESDLPLFK